MNRTELAARVRALLAKTTANGATEAEALSALQKAQELMDKYHLDQGALGMEAEGTTRYNQPFGGRDKLSRQIYAIKNELFFYIGQFTDTKAWHSSNAKAHSFFGLRSDTDFAGWLLEHLAQYVLNQATAYKLDMLLKPHLGTLSHDGEASFMSGACDRINERLKEMVQARKGTPTGRSLIPLKNQIVARDFEKTGVRLSAGRLGTTISGADSGARAAGAAAGNNASFARPVSGRTAGLIGRS